MKKFFAGIAAAAIITVPMTSFALESMSKGALKKATGQAGVSIALDNVVIFMKSQPTTTYWDADGQTNSTNVLGVHSHVGTVTNAGIQISYDEAAQKLITLGAILDGETYGVNKLSGPVGIFKDAEKIGIVDASVTDVIDQSNGDVYTNYVSELNAANNYNTAAGKFMSGISPLTIDVGTCQALSQGYAYNKAYNAGTAARGNYTNLLGTYNTDKAAVATATTNYYTAVGTYGATSSEAGTALTALGAAKLTLTSSETALKNAAGVSTSAQTALAINSAPNIAGVVIGLPTIEINTYYTKDKKHIKLVTAVPVSETAGALNANDEFIAIEKSGKSTMAILGGRIEIAPH